MNVMHVDIETLLRAAEAAGYALAPEDEPSPDVRSGLRSPEAVARQLVTSGPGVSPRTVNARETLQTAADWLKGHLPLNGGRAAA